ncbi:MAG TPA: PfkB family carbohydrate kinase [Bryobacteraceae bacterium]|nr:PfkB family carbohydrate kinase [Bryobacteraceae bacterium]
MRVTSLGEILWDLIGDRELLGGATFNFSVQLSRLGHDVSFLSAVGDDDRGRRALNAASQSGLSTSFLRVVNEAPTGTVSVVLDARGQPSYVLHRPAAYDFAAIPAEDLEPDWIYHGTLQFVEPRMHELLHDLIRCYPTARRFCDINLRKDSYTAAMVMELIKIADVVKLNEEEMIQVQQMSGTSHASIESFCRDYASRFQWEAVCVTRGERGCAILKGSEYAEVPGVPVQVADTVGAGDAFAAAFLHGLDQDWPAARIGEFANRRGAEVASRPGAL